MSDNNMPAGIAEASGHTVLLDNDGCLWVELVGGWTYLTDEGCLGWDIRDRLPEMYEPYRALDKGAAQFIRNNLKMRGVKEGV